jgi:hypothetical protein
MQPEAKTFHSHLPIFLHFVEKNCGLRRDKSRKIKDKKLLRFITTAACTHTTFNIKEISISSAISQHDFEDISFSNNSSERLIK